MEGIEHFDEARNLARIRAGFKGGPFTNSLNQAPAMNFVEGYPDSVDQKLTSTSGPKMNVLDPWVYRSSNAKMK